jgi:hypothetical protein
MGTEQETQIMSMAELDDLARRLLLNTSELRNLILSEPDYQSTDEVAIKVRIGLPLLCRLWEPRAEILCSKEESSLNEKPYHYAGTFSSTWGPMEKRVEDSLSRI